MSRFHSYIRSAGDILRQYAGEEPLASFLKKYFSQHKKHGSRDRKQISHLCYCYFRSGRAAAGIPTEERILLGLFLCSSGPNELLAIMRPDWNERGSAPLTEKLAIAGVPVASVFPWKEQLSDGMEHEKFCASFFIQPDLFLRLRPGHKKTVRGKLQAAGFPFADCGEDCVALPNASRLEEIIELDKEAVVQDSGSQRVKEFFPEQRGIRVWDCCAASGGKSIMLYDQDPTIDLTVSDIRESILANLAKRFRVAGLPRYTAFTADLSRPLAPPRQAPFDLVICDAPCSGSGTWSRTPEQLVYFDEKKIETYARLQRSILGNASAHLKPGGHFLYITCSVFRQENEETVRYASGQFGFRVVRTGLIKGYEQKADTMFAALLEKPL